MQFFSYLLFILVISWVLFFIFLPIINQTPLNWQKGNVYIAPVKNYLSTKVTITKVLSFIILITLIYFGLDLAFIFKK